MSTTSDSPLFTLRPWPSGDRKPKNLSEFIARVQGEHGGFRNVAEEELATELAARLAETGEATEDGQMDVDGPATDAAESPAKDAAAARLEMLKSIDVAHNQAMLSLEFVSLLLTKETPAQAGVSLSKHLRELVGIGTLGSTLLSASNITEDAAHDNHEVAVGWTLMDIKKVRDAALKAHSTLEKEVELESRYWDDVLAVTEHGWAVSRLPQARNVLGVRYGFSEASPEFRNNSLAPLLRGPDGHVQLDLGRVGGGRQRLAVTLEQDGKVISRTTTSTAAAASDDLSTLESKVLEARNTIFSQEMWHELHRESHTLAACGVKSEGTAITCTTLAGSILRFELVTLDESGEDGTASDSHPGGEAKETTTADVIHLCLHLLLSYCHRQNEITRIRPSQPHLPRGRPASQNHLLRPIIARLVHQDAVSQCVQYIGDITHTLRQAGLSSAFFVLTTPPLPTSKSLLSATGNAARSREGAATTLTSTLLGSTTFQIDLVLTPGCSLLIRARTLLARQIATEYQVQLPDAAEHPLREICPPFELGYPDTKSLLGYIRVAAKRAVTSYFYGFMLAEQPSLAPTSPPAVTGNKEQRESSISHFGWVINSKGNSIRLAPHEKRQIAFDIAAQDGRPALEIKALWAAEDGLRHLEEWVWQPDGKGTGDAAGKTIDMVVRQLLASARA